MLFCFIMFYILVLRRIASHQNEYGEMLPLYSFTTGLLWVNFIKFLTPNGTYILNEWVRHTTNLADGVSDCSLYTLTFCRCIILEELMEAILSIRACTISATIPQVLDRTDVVLEVGDRVVAIWRLYVADITSLEWVGNLGCTYLVRDAPC